MSLPSIMVKWELHSRHPTTVIGQIVKKRISHGDALNVDAMIDAYNLLYNGNFKSAEEIRRSFFRDGQPLLTPKQADNVYRATQGKQRGGRDSLINETAESVIIHSAAFSGVPRYLQVQRRRQKRRGRRSSSCCGLSCRGSSFWILFSIPRSLES